MVALLFTAGNASAGDVPRGDLQVGEEVYKEICFACHGLKGDGRGPSAPNFKPRPQVFTNSEYMARMSPRYMYLVVKYGKLSVLKREYPEVTEEDKQTITAMPSFGPVLEPAWVDRLIETEHLLLEGKPIPEDIREVYDGACATCHGPSGRGDGERATEQPGKHAFRSLAQPPPADYTSRPLMERFPDEFRRSLILKGRIAATEEDGFTTMPPFGAELSDEEIWSAVRYIRETFVNARTPGKGRNTP